MVMYKIIITLNTRVSSLFKFIKNKTGIRKWIAPKRIILSTIFITFLIKVWEFYNSGAIDPVVIKEYYAQYPLIGISVFILIYTISVVAALPSLPLNLAAGFFWGGMLGGLYATISVTLGSWISFLISRWLIGQPLAARFEAKWVTTVQNQFLRNGWLFIAFARINPIIPTGPLNYLLGLTSVSNRDFLWVTFVFLLPPSILVAYIGDTVQTFAVEQKEASELISNILMLSAAITIIAFIKFIIYLNYKDKQK